ALFEVSPPRVPAMASGGIVTRPTLALIGEAGPEAVVPLDRGIGGVHVHIERMEVQDGRDFGRRLDEELRRRGLVRAGNVTAWGGRRYWQRCWEASPSLASTYKRASQIGRASRSAAGRSAPGR